MEEVNVTPEMLRETGDKVWVTIREMRRNVRICNLFDELPEDNPIFSEMDSITYKLENLGLTLRGMTDDLEYALQSPTGKTGVKSLEVIVRDGQATLKEANRMIQEGESSIKKLAQEITKSKKLSNADG
jgi:hypothetical protein